MCTADLWRSVVDRGTVGDRLMGGMESKIVDALSGDRESLYAQKGVHLGYELIVSKFNTEEIP